MSTALLLINPHSRQGRKNLPRIQSHLEAAGFELKQENSQGSLCISQLIRNYKDQVDCVIIGGGDGTLNAAIGGLIDTQLPLGILPLGTANDLARTLNIPLSLPEACDVIAKGNYQTIDIGKVNHQYFFNVASIGVSVDITNQLTESAKYRWGVLAYALAAFRVLWQARLFTATIYHHGSTEVVKTLQIAIGNGRHYGGGMTIVHDAEINDQRLDLYSLEINHWWEIIPLLPNFWSGIYPENKVRLLRAKQYGIETKRPYPINTDGEITTETPAELVVIPNALKVITPCF